MADAIRLKRAAARRAHDGNAGWVQRFARVGFAAKAVVYFIIAGIALRAAFGNGSPTDTRGALRAALAGPFGQVVLGALALGLAAYALWKAYCAAIDPEADGVRGRVRNGFIAVVHAAFTVEAARLALTGFAGGGSSGNDSAHWAARALEQPFGAWLLGLVGAGIGAYGLYQLYRAATRRLDDQLRLDELEADRRRIVVAASRAGIAARGVVFVVIGIFVVRAALQHDPSETRNTGGALRALQDQPYGPWLLAAVALGLAGYGIYELLRARYRVIRAAH